MSSKVVSMWRSMRKDRQSFVVHWLKPEQGSSMVEGRWKPWMVAGSTARRGKPLTGVWWDDVESNAVVVSPASPCLDNSHCLHLMSVGAALRGAKGTVRASGGTVRRAMRLC